MPLFDHFSVLAPVYDRWLQYGSREKIISLANLPVDGILLDVGGGTGRAAGVLLDLASQIVVVDVSHPMLLQAAGKDGLQPVGAQAETLPFPDKTFDRIIMVDAFHHLIDQLAAARELWRALKSGGTLIIEEPDIRSGFVKVAALAEKLALMRSHFLSPDRIVKLFPQPESRAEVVREGYIAWIIVEKKSWLPEKTEPVSERL
jgi:demethylmenaquinone methyltransferase/2-methoxy-6-polyprenyl-1,4-benzoquinol methylase